MQLFHKYEWRVISPHRHVTQTSGCLDELEMYRLLSLSLSELPFVIPVCVIKAACDFSSQMVSCIKIMLLMLIVIELVLISAFRGPLTQITGLRSKFHD